MRFALLACLPLAVLAAFSGCSLINAPDDVKAGGSGGKGGDGGAGGDGGSSAPECGDGKKEAGETCDPPSSCPDCDDGDACTADTQAGAAATCDVVCTNEPITECSIEADGCCPSGCSGVEDPDCIECGNGEVEPGETCDGDCPESCDDADACTTDTMTGSAESCDLACTHAPVTSCTSGDGCCPAGCFDLGDTDCFWKPGVLENVAPETLVGWTECFAENFSTSGTALAGVLAQCSKSRLLLACRPPSAANTLKLAAMATRNAVLFNCGTAQACTFQSNGVGWYFSGNYSWGFAPAGEPVSRNSCDTGSTFPNLRMCWHTYNEALDYGYRCGTAYDGLERVIYHAD